MTPNNVDTLTELLAKARSAPFGQQVVMYAPESFLNPHCFMKYGYTANCWTLVPGYYTAVCNNPKDPDYVDVYLDTAFEEPKRNFVVTKE